MVIKLYKLEWHLARPPTRSCWPGIGNLRLKTEGLLITEGPAVASTPAFIATAAARSPRMLDGRAAVRLV